jgi:cytochrome c biogenesis protein
VTALQTKPDEREDDRGPGDLNLRELLRWAWRQLTSMRTALILLLLLALAAVPGSLIPQEGVDALNASRWKDAHTTLTPIYERLGLFDVYGTPWFAAIYLLLMVSLVGCIVPRLFVYWRGMRAQPPVAPRNLTRMPDHAAYGTSDEPDVVLARAAEVLRRKRYRLRTQDDAVSAERGYLREAGNLLFHLSLLVVLVGFGVGSLFGYRGGVSIIKGDTFTNSLVLYDDFVPGRLFGADDLDPFSFTVDDFDVDWLTDGPRAGMAKGFVAHLSYEDSPGATPQTYDLKVNHPLTIDDTDVFLIGHGYAPVLTIRDGDGNVVSSEPTIFLPRDQSFVSYGVVKEPDSATGEIGLDGLLFPTFSLVDGDPVSLFPDDLDPLISMSVYTGDLNMNSGEAQSVYELDTSKAAQVLNDDGTPYRLDLSEGETATLPDGLGSVTYEKTVPWNKIQISKTPGKMVALVGVSAALLGLLGSLFIRPRRVWVRARRDESGGTVVEVGALDRSGGGDVAPVLADIVGALQAPVPEEKS